MLYSKAAFAARTGWRFSHQISVASQPGIRRVACERELKKLLADMPFRFASIDSIKRMKGPEALQAMEDFAAHTRLRGGSDDDARYLDRIVEMFSEQNYVICFGRYVHISMPHAFHALLTCDDGERIERLALDRKVSRNLMEIRLRREEAASRALQERLYPGSSWSESDFDLVLPTTGLSPKRVAELILDRHAAWLAAQDPETIARGAKHIYAPVMQAI